MKRRKYAPRSFGCATGVPFESAEEAWFWFVRCQKARWDGARFEEGAAHCIRPCDPDDLYRALKELRRRRLVEVDHIRVLTRFGFAERPPDRRLRDEVLPWRLWTEAIDQLTTVLRRKGIVE